MQSRGGMGTSKHRESGVAPKSPKLRHQIKRLAEKNDKTRKPTCEYGSVQELMDSN